ncbi:MAG TPA: OmpA family protein [Tepidisphaeraceae bacterium]|jgi:chemotaxis protein MotB
MARMHRLVGIAALSLTLGGCVSQEKYNALKLDRDRYQEQLGQAQNDATQARAEAEAYKGQLAAIMNGQNGRDAMLNNLNQQNGDLQRQLDELNRRYVDALNKQGPGNALPEPLSNALTEFARQNPDLVDFDAARGIVKFKSDVTFSTGSSDLTPKAKEAIGRFAQILNSNAANTYELMVAGHTDNTRVVNPATIAAGHKDNWYLSAHRAISVGSQLMSDSVNPQRLAVTGYADQRPIAANISEGDKARNRRVEVLILPTTVRSNAVIGGETAASHRTTPAPKPAARPVLNKDSATVDPRPVVPQVDVRTLQNK